MPKFSNRSLYALESCDVRIQDLFHEVIKHFDCSILEGHRGEILQNDAHANGKSKLQWPDSKHNTKPSQAVCTAPYPIDWDDTIRFYMFGAFVLGIAAMLGIPIRWGGDWDGDWTHRDQSFHDLGHFEILGD